jgi:Zn-dependent protease with chaperone function
MERKPGQDTRRQISTKPRGTPPPRQPVVGSLRPTDVNWLAVWPGLTRYPKAVTLALLGSWTLLALAIWVAVVAAVIGGVVGFFGVGNTSESYVAGSGSAVGLIGGLLGALAGFAVGFAAIMGTSIVVGASRIAVSLVCGAIVGAAATALLIVIEPLLMYLHGYRPPSNREELVLSPVVREVAAGMHLAGVPQILISDTRTPAAWTHTRHVVLTKRLLDLPPNQLGAILAHEFQHWRTADTAGLLFVSMCGLPLMVTMNIIAYGRQFRLPLVALVCSLLLWPYVVIAKWLIQPVLAMEGRAYEYSADKAAVQAGYGQGLYLALEHLRPFERARSGWEDVLHATHPPMEYRLEAIEDQMKEPRGAVQTVPALQVPVPPTNAIPEEPGAEEEAAQTMTPLDRGQQTSQLFRPTSHIASLPERLRGRQPQFPTSVPFEPFSKAPPVSTPPPGVGELPDHSDAPKD